MAKQNYIKKSEFEKIKKEFEDLKKQKKVGTADEAGLKRLEELETFMVDAVVINDNQEIVTQEGREEMANELNFLVSVRRAEVAEKLKEARGHGDLSENSEYDEAKAEQQSLEEKIARLQYILDNCVVVSEIDISRVGIGSDVTVYNVEGKEEITFSIVGSTGVDYAQNKISDKSPVGAALVGHKVGDKISVVVPAGVLNFEIRSIKESKRSNS